MVYKHRGEVKGGKLELWDRNKFLEDCQSHEGKQVYLTVAPYTKSRSEAQNNYYWGVVIKILSEETGFSADEMHEVLKNMFLVKVREDLKGRTFPVGVSTTKLTTAEFEEFLAKVREWASIELNCYIPEPNEVE